MADVLKKVPVREQDPQVRATNFDEVWLGYNKEEARKEFATGKRDDDAYRKLCMQHGETVSPDRKV